MSTMKSILWYTTFVTGALCGMVYLDKAAKDMDISSDTLPQYIGEIFIHTGIATGISLFVTGAIFGVSAQIITK